MSRCYKKKYLISFKTNKNVFVMISLDTKCFHLDKTWNASFMFLMKSFWRECRPPTKNAEVLECFRYIQSEVDSVWISVFVLQKHSYSSMLYNIFFYSSLGICKAAVEFTAQPLFWVCRHPLVSSGGRFDQNI